MSMMNSGRCAARAHDVLNPGAGQHRFGRAGCRHDDVGGGQRAARGRSTAWRVRRAAWPAIRPCAGSGWRWDLLDPLRPQVHAGQLRHPSRAEDEDVQAREVAENLPGERDGRVADRDRALADAGFGRTRLPTLKAVWNNRLVTAECSRCRWRWRRRSSPARGSEVLRRRANRARRRRETGGGPFPRP